MKFDAQLYLLQGVQRACCMRRAAGADQPESRAVRQPPLKPLVTLVSWRATLGGHAKLLCIVPILTYVPKEQLSWGSDRNLRFKFLISDGSVSYCDARPKKQCPHYMELAFQILELSACVEVGPYFACILCVKLLTCSGRASIPPTLMSMYSLPMRRLKRTATPKREATAAVVSHSQMYIHKPAAGERAHSLTKLATRGDPY
eukprot:1025052-Pelagomonas_calceolata.AAC.8